MGDTQSAPRESKKDAEAEEDRGKAEDAHSNDETAEQPFKNSGEISELSGKADGSVADISGHCEDELAAEAFHSQDKDVSRPENLPTELENVELSETQIPEANEEEPVEIIDMEVKQNDINESFRRFFSNIGLKLTVKRGSADTGEITTDVPDETNKDEVSRPEDESIKENKSEDVEQNIEVTKVQETFDNDSTTCPTLTDGISEDVLVSVEEKITETKDQALNDIPETVMNLPIVQDAKGLVDDVPTEEPDSSSPSNRDEEVVSPIKKFFTTGIFSSLRKKKLAEDETADKELVDMRKKESVNETGQTVQDQQEQTQEITPGVEAHELKDEIQPAESAQTTDSSEVKSSSTNQSRIIVNEPEMLTSQEKDKVQASPLKRLLSGSSFTRRSKKQKGRRSSDSKLSDSGEHIEDQLMSSTESTECQTKDKESPAPPLYAEGPVEEEEGAWASFKKLMTPKKRMKQPPLSNDETQIPVAVDEQKAGDREQISDHSTEESKKRKDSSVSWEAVLCGSGRRRSRKTSDSEEEMPQGENDKVKQDGETHGVEPHVERSNEVDDITACSPKQAGSPSESDGGLTWKSFKKLVTPKRKAKDEEEGRENIQSDGEVTQEESSFSIKKLLPGRKKRKPAEKPDQVSSDEADKEAASGDEDSETPAVVPLSEFDTPEAEGHIQTQANIESIPKVPDHILQQDQLSQMTEHLQTSANEVQDSNEVLVNQTSTIPVLSEEPDDLTELISKHQQLSDIPEEGIITDTMATPASVTEEAARDDTIAEDFIEITSEAITAPEPVDSTQADETEMVSAVSQLSESSKTSGNTTPVPAEYDLKETQVLLQQVVETISETPDAITVSSEDLYPERIAGSVSHQILETVAKEEQTILKLHRQSDATAIRTGLKVSTLDEFDETAASAQTECISELNEAISTEIASEVSTEFDSAQIAEDEVHKVNISQPHESIKQFEQVESKDDNRFQMQSQSEVTESVSTEILQKGEDVPDEASLLGVHEGEEEPSKIDTQDKGLSAVDETAALVTEQEVESLLEIKDEITQHDSTAELTEAKEQLAKADDVPENQDEQQADAAKTEYIQNSEMLESQLSTTPVEDSVQSTQKEHTEVTVDEADKEPKPDAVKTDEVPAQEEDIFESLEKEITEDDAAKEPEHEPPADTVKTDHDQVVEILDSGVGTAQVPEKEIKDDVAAETDKPQEKAELFTEVAEELEIVQKSTLNSKEGTILSPEEKVKSEDHSQAETHKFKQETDSGLQNKDEQLMNAYKPEHAQEPEVLDVAQAATLNSGVILEDTAAPDVDESTEETKASGELEELPLEATKTEHDENKVVTETETQQSIKVGIQPDQALENENHKTENTTDDVLLSMQVEQEDLNTQDVDKIQPVIAVHISSVNEDTGTAQILEKTVITEETPAPCVDKTAAVDEPEHEIHLSEVQVGVKEEKEGHLPHTETRTAEMECAAVPEIIAFNLKDVMAAIPDLVLKKSSIESEDIEISEVTPVPCVDNIVAQDEPEHKIYVSEVQVSTEKEEEQQFSSTEMGTTQVQHAVVAEVITCNVEEVTSAIPDIFILQLSEVHEDMIGIGTNEQEFRETAETAPVLTEDKVTDTVQEGNTVVMMHMPSVEFEDSPSIQVQIVDVDIKSAETRVDTVKAGVTQTKEIIDVCHETVTKVDNVSATFQIEEEIPSEEDNVTIQEVLQHVKERLPEPKPVAEVGQKVEEQPNDSTQPSGTVEKTQSEEEGKKMEEDTTGPDVTSDDFEAKQEIKHDQTPDLPGTLDVSFHDDKEDSDKTKAELEKTEGVTADQLAVKRTDEEEKEAQSTQSAQTQMAPPNTTALAIPQSTGIMSSLGNVEPPSSLSLEFKLNIQFGQSKTPASPTSSPSLTERTEFVKSAEMSEVGIQAVEKIQVVTQTTETQGAETQKRTSLTEAAVQATEVPESAVTPESLETALIKDPPVLMDVGIQSVGTGGSEEHIRSAEEVTPCVQGAETIQPVQPPEKPQVLLIQPLVSEVSAPQVEVVEEEECEQDVWMDAEENISTPDETEVPRAELEESLEYQSDNDKESKTEFHMAHTEEEESHQEMHTADGTAEIESEGEDFTVAAEDPENATTSTSTTEKD
ncbi:A-kinase anchor protein 12-like isoform X2 [Sphaeramia orbicularis]|uniref:A-kinase anchor protein 12-like isoform X2 n=1 Tax=Sphaeramia orbicularis TaxID=375764 RepID=UPI00117C03BC|nr:A-kinase anchor protein 12-like isoform X2 [Sphaeramia orbicularis]